MNYRLGFLWLLFLFVGCAGGPSISKKEIDKSWAPEVQAAIHGLYSSGSELAKSLRQLGTMKEKAAPAIPFLISMLGDRRLIRTRFSGIATNSPVGTLAASALVKIGHQALTPIIAELDKQLEQRYIRGNIAWYLKMLKNGKEHYVSFKGGPQVDILIRALKECMDTSADLSFATASYAVAMSGRSGIFTFSEMLGTIGDKKAISVLSQIAQGSEFSDLEKGVAKRALEKF